MATRKGLLYRLSDVEKMLLTSCPLGCELIDYHYKILKQKYPRFHEFMEEHIANCSLCKRKIAHLERSGNDYDPD